MRMSTGHECTKRKLPTEVALGCRRPTLASKGMEQTSVNTVISNLFQSDTENSRSSNRYNNVLCCEERAGSSKELYKSASM